MKESTFSRSLIRRRVVSAQKAGRRTLVCTAVVSTVCAVALSGCAGASPESVISAPKAGSTSTRAALTDAPDVDLGYTGKVETAMVPAGVHSAYVELAGGSGSDPFTHTDLETGNTYFWGYGVRISGRFAVHPGDVLTLAVGGVGGKADGNKSPGGGGWSLNDHYKGGRGGSGHGSQTRDGGGGGGASVIQVNGQTTVVAGGGGGGGGAVTKLNDDAAGGSAGSSSGNDGEAMVFDANGKGGSSSHPSLDQGGHSYSGSLLEGGGGGGGGGRYTGGGGLATTSGGGGGGGGSSLNNVLSSPQVMLTGGGNGYVHAFWEDVTPGDRTITVAKASPKDANGEFLEMAPGRSSAGQLADVSSMALTGPDPSDIAPFQVWTYRTNGGQGNGQLVNKQTGLCLQVNGVSGAIDQWDCTTEDNHLWKMMANPSGGQSLQVYLDRAMGPYAAGFYFLATAVPSNQVGPGTTLKLTSDQDDTASWKIAAPPT